MNFLAKLSAKHAGSGFFGRPNFSFVFTKRGFRKTDKGDKQRRQRKKTKKKSEKEAKNRKQSGLTKKRGKKRKSFSDDLPINKFI